MRKFALSVFILALPLIPLHASQDEWRAEEYFHNSSSQKEAAADLMKYVTIKGAEKVLDVGCGDGKITAEIAAKLPYGTIVGVDISPSMIEFAQKAFPQEQYSNLSFALKDAQGLDYQDKFDLIFSFTALQWVKSHEAFLAGAYRGLHPSGTLAVTMPMGLPSTLEQAVNEIIAGPEWSSYFTNFSTGWNFVNQDVFGKLLADHHFTPVRLAIVPQKDIFPNRAVFENFIRQWFPYLRPLPQELKDPFLKQVVDRFLQLESPFPNGELHFKIRRLEVVAKKGD
jgi:trans-aconitate 2-methyltransferase